MSWWYWLLGGARAISAKKVIPFCNVVRSTASPSTTPTGIGGSASTIWHCDENTGNNYELSVTDFSVIRSAAMPHPADSYHSIGGDSGTIWHSFKYTTVTYGVIYELSTTDFSVIRSHTTAAPMQAGTPSAVGGSSTKLWTTSTNGEMYELSVTDFSILKTGAQPKVLARGVGGDSSVLWFEGYDATWINPKIYELSQIDFSVIRSCNPPNTTWPYDVGGSLTALWHCDSNTDKIYELGTG